MDAASQEGTAGNDVTGQFRGEASDRAFQVDRTVVGDNQPQAQPAAACAVEAPPASVQVARRSLSVECRCPASTERAFEQAQGSQGCLAQCQQVADLAELLRRPPTGQLPHDAEDDDAAFVEQIGGLYAAGLPPDSEVLVSVTRAAKRNLTHQSSIVLTPPRKH